MYVQTPLGAQATKPCVPCVQETSAIVSESGSLSFASTSTEPVVSSSVASTSSRATGGRFECGSIATVTVASFEPATASVAL